ncbi:hypothetical protein [Amycolatopsis taiwanensis]|uniref:Peptide zinc metalloprotease protein n=1 Tax=Amycolatopsis taiwanensis TaxID=342230 RepID=A0A9W6R2D5_9PSEU|nr:hypothetical protein [Amycolatopsis taiwanensis]GLY67125.1 hypothetical protein Atai01_37440 [Amycolatopsis taiwanensis]
MTRQIPHNAPTSPPAAADPGPLAAVDPDLRPVRAEGLSLLGEYEGGGYDEPRYLVSRGDGQMVLVSRMLNAVLAGVGDGRTLAQIAENAGQTYGAVLSPEAVHYLIEHKLKPLGLAGFGEEEQEERPRANPLLGLSLRGVLLPAKVVRRLAAVFYPLFVAPVIVTVLLALGVLDVWLLATGHANASIHASIGSPLLMLAVFGVMLANTLFHECGHAAGCHYGGGQPGAIGVGVLIMVPAFYTNVNDAYRLDRRGRLRTDLGGIYFNAVFAVVIGAIYLLTGFAPLPAIIVLIHLQILQQLIPLVRLDGYYILGDLVGVPNLFEQIPHILRRAILRREPARPIATLRPRTRRIITAWVALVVPALIAALVNLILFLPSYLHTASINIAHYWQVCGIGIAEGDVGIAAVAVISIVVLLVPWVGLTSLVLRTIAKVTLLVARRRRKAAAESKRRGGACGTEGGVAAYQRQATR